MAKPKHMEEVVVSLDWSTLEKSDEYDVPPAKPQKEDGSKRESQLAREQAEAARNSDRARLAEEVVGSIKEQAEQEKREAEHRAVEAEAERKVAEARCSEEERREAVWREKEVRLQREREAQLHREEAERIEREREEKARHLAAEREQADRLRKESEEQILRERREGGVQQCRKGDEAAARTSIADQSAPPWAANATETPEQPPKSLRPGRPLVSSLFDLPIPSPPEPTPPPALPAVPPSAPVPGAESQAPSPPQPTKKRTLLGEAFEKPEPKKSASGS